MTNTTNSYDTTNTNTLEQLYGTTITPDFSNNPGTETLNIIGSNPENVANIGVGILGPNTNNNTAYAVVTSYALPIKPSDQITDMASTPYTQNNILGNAQEAWDNGNIGYAYYNDPQNSGKYIQELFNNGNTAADADEAIITAPNDESDSIADNKITTQETMVVNEGINNASYTSGFTAYNKLYLYSSSGDIYTITIDTGSTNINNTITWTKMAGNSSEGRGQNFESAIIGKTLLAGGSIGTTNSNYQTLNANETYTSPLHTVVININNTVETLINTLKTYNELNSSDTNVADWSLLGVSTGIETTQIGASGGLFVQSSNIYSNATASTDTDSIQQINLSSTDIAIPQTIVTNADSTNTITLNQNNNSTLISNGNDNINIYNHNTLTTTMHGTELIHTSTNDSNLVASIDSTANTTIEGKYASVYLSPINNSNGISNLNTNTIFGLTGDGSASYMGNVNAVGYGASLNIDHNNNDTIDGTFDNLTLNDNSKETAYAEIDSAAYINTNANTNNINLTANDAKITLMGNTGNVNLWGENYSQLALYGNANNNINGTWFNIHGVIGTNTIINSAIDDANIYNDGGNVTLTGTYNNGTLTYNGTGTANIVGTFGAVNATIGANQSIHASIGNDSYITVTSGGAANLWNRTGTINAINQDGGTLDVTMGSGYTGITIDMSKESNTNITNFQGTNGQIILNNLATNTLSISYDTTNNTTNITDAGTKGDIILSGTQHISTLAMPNSDHSLMLIYP